VGYNEIIAELRAIADWCAQAKGPSPLDQALGEYLNMARWLSQMIPSIAIKAISGWTPTEARIAAIAARGLEGNMTIEEIAKSTQMGARDHSGAPEDDLCQVGVNTQPAFVAEARRQGFAWVLTAQLWGVGGPGSLPVRDNRRWFATGLIADRASPKQGSSL